jgi:hypothetical protein
LPGNGLDSTPPKAYRSISAGIPGEREKNHEIICIVRNPNYIASIDQKNKKMGAILLGILSYGAFLKCST